MDNKPLSAKDGADLAAEFRSHRERSGLSLHDVFEVTRIPLDVLEAFERNALHDHPTFNRVYLRSVVRSYASAIGFPEADALAALESAESKTEVVATAQAHDDGVGHQDATPGASALRPGAATQKPGAATQKPDAERELESGVKHVHPRSEKAGIDPVVVTTSTLRLVGLAAVVLIILGAATIYFVMTPFDTTAPESASRMTAGEAADTGRAGGRARESSASGIDDAPLANASPADGTADARTQPLRSQGDQAQNEPAQSGVVLGSDSLPVVAKPPSAPPPDQWASTDSVAVMIHSLGEPVRGIKIRLDKGLRRPYWIERDSTLTLYFKERAIIEDHGGLVRVEAPALAYSASSPQPGNPITVRR